MSKDEIAGDSFIIGYGTALMQLGYSDDEINAKIDENIQKAMNGDMNGGMDGSFDGFEDLKSDPTDFDRD